jgi:hypothetical protein
MSGQPALPNVREQERNEEAAAAAADEDPGLGLAEIALGLLKADETGAERYRLQAMGAAVVEGAVAATLASGEPETAMKQRFKELLRVCCVLEEKMNSPTAARQLAVALFTNPALFSGYSPPKIFATNAGARSLSSFSTNRGRGLRLT